MCIELLNFGQAWDVAFTANVQKSCFWWLACHLFVKNYSVYQLTNQLFGEYIIYFQLNVVSFSSLECYLLGGLVGYNSMFAALSRNTLHDRAKNLALLQVQVRDIQSSASSLQALDLDIIAIYSSSSRLKLEQLLQHYTQLSLASIPRVLPGLVIQACYNFLQACSKMLLPSISRSGYKFLRMFPTEPLCIHI